MFETRRCPTGGNKWTDEGDRDRDQAAAAAATLSYYTFFVVKQINFEFFGWWKPNK